MTLESRAPNEVWNQWVSEARETEIERKSERHSAIILGWIEQIGRRDLKILDAGCGSGWMSVRMLPYGEVTGIDLADEALSRSRQRWPDVNFIAGDFLQAALPENSYDVITSLEVLSHVPDQSEYIAKVARLLKPGGFLLMATQNRPVLERCRLPPPNGWIRRWVDRDELAALIAPHLRLLNMATVEPPAIKEGLPRVLTAGKVMRAMNALTVGHYRRWLEHAGLGWTIMCRAQKPA